MTGKPHPAVQNADDEVNNLKQKAETAAPGVAAGTKRL